MRRWGYALLALALLPVAVGSMLALVLLDERLGPPREDAAARCRAAGL